MESPDYRDLDAAAGQHESAQAHYTEALKHARSITCLDLMMAKQLLKNISRQDLLEMVTPEELLAGLKPEDRLAGLSVQEIEQYLAVLKKQTSSTSHISKKN